MEIVFVRFSWYPVHQKEKLIDENLPVFGPRRLESVRVIWLSL